MKWNVRKVDLATEDPMLADPGSWKLPTLTRGTHRRLVTYLSLNSRDVGHGDSWE